MKPIFTTAPEPLPAHRTPARLHRTIRNPLQRSQQTMAVGSASVVMSTSHPDWPAIAKNPHMKIFAKGYYDLTTPSDNSALHQPPQLLKTKPGHVESTCSHQIYNEPTTENSQDMIPSSIPTTNSNHSRCTTRLASYRANT